VKKPNTLQASARAYESRERKLDGVPPPRFSLSLLGRFELAGPGGVVDLPSKKLAALLVYLACTAPKPQPREILSALLWGSYFDVQAKQNLRQALRAAAELCRGPLVDDVAVSDEGGNEWLTSERKRLLELALHAIGLGEKELVAARAEHAP
jgi:hypothetical protein